MNFTIEQIERYRAAKHGERQCLAEAWGIPYNSLRGAMSRLNAAEPDYGGQASNLLKTIAACPPPIQIAKQPEPLKLTSFLYAADGHCPLHDDDMITKLCRVGHHLGIQGVILGGDMLDFDSLSSHGDDIEQIEVNQCIEVTGEVLRFIKSHFEVMFILPGNHDRRLARRLNKNLSFRNLLKMAMGDLTGMVSTEHDFFEVDTPYGEGGWTLGHPRFFASFPAKGLDIVAQQRNRNAIGAHSHTQGVARVGRYLAVSPGHMMRDDIVPYLVRGNGMSKHPDQGPAKGFVLVESIRADGDVLTLFGSGLTRWSDYR